MLRVLDVVSSDCAIFSPAGSLIHESPTLRRVMFQTDDAERVLEEAAALARVLGATERAATRASHASQGSRSACHAVETSAGRYELAGCVVPQGLFDDDRSVVVAVRRVAPRAERVPAADFQARYRLTPREVEVAHLIAVGDSNQRIADRLQLSVRTVHHHTERVLRKLGVRGRAAVASHVYRTK